MFQKPAVFKMERKARINTKTMEVLLFQKPAVFKMDRKARMSTKPMEVLLFQPISIEPSICHRREKGKCGLLISVFLK